MASEVRHVFFSDIEVSEGFRLRERDKNGIGFSSFVDSIKIEGGKGVEAVLKLGNGISKRFTASEIAEALVMYCKAEGIMLPRRSLKSLSTNGQGLVLSIVLGGQPRALPEPLAGTVDGSYEAIRPS